MNWIDLLLIITILMSVWASVQRGFIISAADLLCWLGSFAAGFLGYKPFSELLLQIFPLLGFWSVPLAFIITIMIARLVLDQLAAQLLYRLPEPIHSNILNKVLGILPGLVNGLIWAALMASLLLFVPLSTQVSRETQESRFADQLIDKAGWVQDKLHPIFSEAFKTGIAKTTPEISKEESVKLPYTVQNPRIRADLEADMLILLNEERAKEGLKPLSADPELAEVARKHSIDMFARGYFSHINPDGENPFQRIDAANVRYFSAGENLALAQTLNIAHTGLMNSPGHRANIMNPGFGRVGIAVLDGKIYGLMITQNFRN